MITDAHYLYDFSLKVTFNTGKSRILDFLPLFQQFVKGDNLKFFAPERFKKFILKNGNIYWGKNEDVIFPVQLLYSGSSIKDQDEDAILFTF